jgi:hypothetical protein
LFFVGCLILSASIPSIKANMQSASMVQEINRAKTEKIKQIEIGEALLAKQEAIASNRFKKGCIMVVAMKSPDNFTGLTEGLPVIDRVRKTPLAANNVVCDANGGTAVLVKSGQKAVVGEVFFTGDRALIEAAKKRANARYALPNQE